METGQIVVGQLCANTEVSPEKIADHERLERMAKAATLASKTAAEPPTKSAAARRK
jgi:hypothetical protein